MGHNLFLHHILDFFYAGGAAELLTGKDHAVCDSLNLHRRHALLLRNGVVGFADGYDNFGNIESIFSAVSFYDLHGFSPSVAARALKGRFCHVVSYNKILCIDRI